MSDFFGDNRGSFTVEASVIFPIIFLCIITIVYICLLLYQVILVQAVADRSVGRGTATWSNPEKTIASGEVSKQKLNKGGLYWRLFDTHKGVKTNRLESYLNGQMGHFDVLKGTYKVSEPKLDDSLVYKKLAVDVESDYKIPVGKLLVGFGLEDHLSIKVHSEAVVNEPVEFIRNTDFIIDIEKEVESNNEWAAKLGNSVRGFMEKVMETVERFWDK